MNFQYHLSEEMINAFGRSQLSVNEHLGVEAHLGQCQQCSLKFSFSDAAVENLYRELAAGTVTAPEPSLAMVA